MLPTWRCCFASRVATPPPCPACAAREVGFFLGAAAEFPLLSEGVLGDDGLPFCCALNTRGAPIKTVAKDTKDARRVNARRYCKRVTIDIVSSETKIS